MEIHNDTDGIAHALQLAWKGLFITSPNPRVGCVIVKGSRVIGEGYTQPAGQAHAEVQALRDAAARGEDVRGTTAYVTLEPCSHYGRTPPCADALVNAGLARVVAAIADPNPLVAGRGLDKLKAAGVDTVCGVLEEQAREINIGFFSRMQRGKPWVRMKAAASLDGKTALHNGRSQWITSEMARDDGHWWRARACAVLTGIGTVQQDDPQLNVRAVPTTRQPQRIVIDSRLQIDPGARILDSGGTLIVAAQADAGKEAQAKPGRLPLAKSHRERQKPDPQQAPADRRRRPRLQGDAGDRAGEIAEIIGGGEPAAGGQRKPLVLLHQREDRGQRKAPDPHGAGKRQAVR